MLENQIALDKEIDSIKKTDLQAGDYWSARELGSLLGYQSWRKIEVDIKAVMVACKQIGFEVSEHVRASSKSLNGATNGKQNLEDDYLLSGFACHLLVANLDYKNPAIALAQSYFAIAAKNPSKQRRP